MKICVGGTFNNFHKGHKFILNKAFEFAGKDGKIYIGLSTGDLVKNKKNTKPLEIRQKKLEDYLIEKGFNTQAIIVPIDNKFGLTLQKGFDAIVISPEKGKLCFS